MNVNEAILFGRDELKTGGISEYSSDAEIILSFTLDKERTFIHSHPEYLLTESEMNDYKDHIRRRKSREPLAYIRGFAYFYGRRFSVSSATLIPREETEILIEYIIKNAPENGKIIDIGTGSGIIAVTAKIERNDLTVIAGDISAEALDTAKKNSEIHNADIDFRKSDLLKDIPDEDFDIIAANLPYIPQSEKESLQTEVREYEPHTALFSGDDGLELINGLICAAKTKLTEKGAIILEIGVNQAEKVIEILGKRGYNNISVIKDYAGIDRIVLARQ